MRAALIAVLAGLACGTARAQQANVNLDYNPQKNTENLVPFSAPLNSPDVRDDRTVTFRLKAPEARTVSLAGVAILTALGQEKPVPFQRGTDGVWSLTVGPLRPDMYAYHLFVGQGTQEAKGRMGQRCVALHEALLKHGVRHEYYVGGHGGHDWATWRHLVHERFLPGLWRAHNEGGRP